jgi:hypothetical protein
MGNPQTPEVDWIYGNVKGEDWTIDAVPQVLLTKIALYCCVVELQCQWLIVD